MKIGQDKEGGTSYSEKWRRAVRFWLDFLLARHQCFAATFLYPVISVCAMCYGLFLTYTRVKVMGRPGQVRPGRCSGCNSCEHRVRAVLSLGKATSMCA